MSFWSKIARLLTVDDTILDERFSLLPHGEPNNNHQEPAKNTQTPPKNTKTPAKNTKRTRVPYYQITNIAPKGTKSNDAESEIPDTVTNSLDHNRQIIEKIFHVPINKDLVIRELFVSFETVVKGFVVFMQGVSDSKLINANVIEPLSIWASVPPATSTDLVADVKMKLVAANQVKQKHHWNDVKNEITSGSTAIFLQGSNQVLIVDTKGWKHRGVSEPKTEAVVRGPHEAFTENLGVNIGLIRSRLQTEKLITEMMQVGELAPTAVAVMYVTSIVNPRLVKEVKRRIKRIKVDFLQDSGQMEEFLEDPPRRLLLPRMMATERPDRVAASLAEGFVVVFVGQSPYALILPTTLWSLIQTAEDYYIRYPFGSFIRLIRFTSVLIALLLPSFYIAVTNFHPEMIPTDLMLAIASAREQVPFPVVMEVLLMELALELIREAGIRIPSVIGPTIGIVGALILGQAAVQAGIISPLLVIVVAVTALASFALPNYNLAFAVRMLRFVFILLASSWGFYGIALGMMVLLMQWATMKSLGVPMLSPVSPSRPSSPDVILRGAMFDHEVRPGFLRPQDSVRQKKFTRTWDPSVHDSNEAQEQSGQGGEKHD